MKYIVSLILLLYACKLNYIMFLKTLTIYKQFNFKYIKRSTTIFHVYFIFNLFYTLLIYDNNVIFLYMQVLCNGIQH